jgi:hypothetical protein
MYLPPSETFRGSESSLTAGPQRAPASPAPRIGSFTPPGRRTDRNFQIQSVILMSAHMMTFFPSAPVRALLHGSSPPPAAPAQEDDGHDADAGPGQDALLPRTPVFLFPAQNWGTSRIARRSPEDPRMSADRRCDRTSGRGCVPHCLSTDPCRRGPIRSPIGSVRIPGRDSTGRRPRVRFPHKVRLTEALDRRRP